MASFSLVPDPTFKAKVDIPIPGKKAQKVELTFKWLDSDDFKSFLQGLESYDSDTDAVMDFVTGWELSDAFSRENVEKMVKNYIGSARAIINVYIEENTGARLGNSAR